jgi:succinoglycan biosynthesis transport protein ExoP
MEFWKIYRLVKARRWLILGLLLITLLTVFVAKKAVDEQTQYDAIAVVLPDSAAMSPQGLFQGSGNGDVGPTYDRLTRIAMFTQSIQNQFDAAANLAGQPSLDQKRAVVSSLASQISQETAHLRYGWTSFPDVTNVSSAVLDKVLTDAQVPIDPAFWVPRPISPSLREQMQASLIAEPIVNNTIAQGPNSGVITDYLQIGVSAPDANLASQMANLLAASFINNYHKQGTQEYYNSINTVRAAQKAARNQLDTAQNNLVNFERVNPLVNPSVSLNADVSNLVGLRQSLEKAEQTLEVSNQTAATYDQLAEKTGPSLVVNLNPLARRQTQELQAQIDDLQAQVTAMRSQYTAANPKMQRAEAALKAKQDEFKQLESQPYTQATANIEYQTLHNDADQERATATRAEATISSLKNQIAQQETQNKTLPEAQKKYTNLAEDLASAQENQKIADANAAAMLESNKLVNQGLISLSSPAIGALPDASGPSLGALLIYGAILSLIIGIGIALGLDYLDNSVQTIPDAERLLGMPVSAVIPEMPSGDPRRMTRLTVSDPLSPIAESYRLLRTDLLFTAEEKPFQSLMAATAKPGQGATTTICNLAVALANVGKRVILIDADLRRPKLHDFFSVSNEKGLTSVLNGDCELEEALKVTDIDNLLVLPSGPLPLNPAELLASQKMRALHERLKPHTDFVLVDTPSAIAFSDSSILASYLDAVMIVVRAQETPRGSEVQLKNLLAKARANVVGVVLNGVKPQLVDSYYYHAAYYPQVAPGHTLGISNGAVLSMPTNGAAKNGGPRTLEADSLDEAFSSHDGDEDTETTAILDDIVSVTPAQPRARFSIRRMFGNDNRD